MKNYYFDTTKNLRPLTFALDANENSEAPSNALRVEPEFKDGFWPCEKNGEWVLVEDHRNAVVYSTETGAKVEIKEVGELPEGVTNLERPDQYHTWSGSSWEITKEADKQRQSDEKEVSILSAKGLLNDANKQIEIIQDRIDLDDYESDEELVEIKSDLKAWKKYRIELNKFIKGEHEEMPEAII